VPGQLAARTVLRRLKREGSQSWLPGNQYAVNGASMSAVRAPQPEVMQQEEKRHARV
jgi:hypothetical protein